VYCAPAVISLPAWTVISRRCLWNGHYDLQTSHHWMLFCGVTWSPWCAITDREELRTPGQHPWRESQPLHNKHIIKCVIFSKRDI
jgi:hypothetical protein